jgi:hypothetical protein
MASVFAVAQEVSVANGIGYGTTGMYARTFGTVVETNGTAITYVPDPVNGVSFMINASGVYAISYTEGDPGTDDVGISVNLAATSPFSTGWGTAQEICGFEVSNSGGSCSATLHLSKGDVLRAHSTFGGPPPNSQPIARFIVTKVK